VKTAVLALTVLGLVLAGCGGREQAEEPTATPTTQLSAPPVADYGAQGALASDSELSVEQMLTYAIQDEQLAEAEYLDALARYGDIRPFNNIVESERRHIEALETLFAARGLDAPANLGAQHVVPTESVRAALAACVEGEKNNIEMYRVFLERELPADVAEVFANLKQASEQHLETFQFHLDR
jgi:hypothetical protein